ncbi:MAG: DUF2062 domain-containing protein [Nitrospinota bacterium]
MRRKLKGLVKTVLHMKGEPKKIALAFSIGIFVAFFPIYGTHTIMALGGAWLFGVSPAVTLAGTLINNPWTIAPLYGSSLYVGMAITGQTMEDLSINWSDQKIDTMLELAKTLLLPFSVGCILLGIISAAVSYIIALKVVVSYRKSRHVSPQESRGGS